MVFGGVTLEPGMTTLPLSLVFVPRLVSRHLALQGRVPVGKIVLSPEEVVSSLRRSLVESHQYVLQC